MMMLKQVFLLAAAAAATVGAYGVNTRRAFLDRAASVAASAAGTASLLPAAGIAGAAAPSSGDGPGGLMTATWTPPDNTSRKEIQQTVEAVLEGLPKQGMRIKGRQRTGENLNVKIEGDKVVVSGVDKKTLAFLNDSVKAFGWNTN